MEIISKSVTDTIKIGKAIATNVQKGDIICLFGQLGTGKTVLAKGIAHGLGIKRDKVISPSFVLIRQYHGSKLVLCHFDFYRLKIPGDIVALGYEEYFYNEAVTVVEWADRLKSLLPKEYLKVELSVKGRSLRLIKFAAFGNHYKELLRSLEEIARDL